MLKLKRYDNRLRRTHGIRRLAGVDEAGRGALAGPVVAAVVVLEPEAVLRDVNDSKQLTPEAREAMVPEILAKATEAWVGLATAEEVDRINILQATYLAAGRALACLREPPEYMVTDFLKINPAPCPVLAIKDGDATSLAVAAASVLAKVARDRIMRLLDAEYPQFGFAQHKGYATPQHWEALNEHGPCTLHRMTYNGVSWFDIPPEICSQSALRGLLKVEPVAPLVAPDRLPLMELLCDGHESIPVSHFLPRVDFEMRVTA